MLAHLSLQRPRNQQQGKRPPPPPEVLHSKALWIFNILQECLRISTVEWRGGSLSGIWRNFEQNFCSGLLVYPLVVSVLAPAPSALGGKVGLIPCHVARWIIVKTCSKWQQTARPSSMFLQLSWQRPRKPL